MEEKGFCLCCGEDVAVLSVTRGGAIESTCVHCGFPVDVSRCMATPPASPAGIEVASVQEREQRCEDVPCAPLSPRGDAGAIGAESAHESFQKTAHFDVVLVADDSKFMRELTRNLLVKKNIAADVICCENGLKLVSGFKDLIQAGKSVDAAIIDIHMPRMDGITAARVLRKIEIENRISPATFIFFSAVKSDEKLRQLMQAVAPAYYVNKGNDRDARQLARRISQLFYAVFGCT